MVQEKITMKMESVALGDFVKNYIDYNLWTNLALIRWLGSKPAALLEQEVSSSFPSICLTLHHMWKTQAYWFSIINGKKDFKEEEYSPALDKVLAGLIEQSARIADFVKAMSEADFQEEVLVESQWFSCELSTFEYIMQLVNHNTYHRGQVVSIGRSLGFTDAPNTDYNFYNVMGR